MSMATELMIQAEGLTKAYGSTQALAGVDISVPAGTILGLLGPNGAGKTTAVRVLTTLARPDSGSATVAGIDVLKHPAEVRRHIGPAAHGPPEPGADRRAVGPGPGGVPVPGQGAPGAVRADRRRRPRGQGLLGRHASPAGPRRLPDDPSAGP